MVKKNKKLNKRAGELKEKVGEDRELLNSYDRVLKEGKEGESMAEIEKNSGKIQEQL